MGFRWSKNLHLSTEDRRRINMDSESKGAAEKQSSVCRIQLSWHFFNHIPFSVVYGFMSGWPGCVCASVGVCVRLSGRPACVYAVCAWLRLMDVDSCGESLSCWWNTILTLQPHRRQRLGALKPGRQSGVDIQLRAASCTWTRDITLTRRAAPTHTDTHRPAKNTPGKYSGANEGLSGDSPAVVHGEVNRHPVSKKTQFCHYK